MSSFFDYLKHDILEYQAERFMSEFIKSEKGYRSSSGPLKDFDFICTNGTDPLSLSKHDYLTAFAQGPCAPVAVIPGITGSKLIARIDCPVLKESNPKLFADCGWNACEKGFLKLVPKNEYRIWMPDALGPMSISTLDKNRRCFAGFAALYYKLEKGQYIPIVQPGVTVYPLGESPDTTSDSECGFDAIQNTYPAAIQPADRYLYFGRLKDALISAGYIVGLTLQALPYDWRLSYAVHRLDEDMPKIIEEMSSMVGKKIMLVAHSMGNYQVAHNIWKSPQPWEDQYVARYIAIAPPYLGAPQTVENPLGMDGALDGNIGPLKVGLDVEQYKSSVALYPAVWQLMPRPTFRIYNDTTWMKAINERISAEEHKTAIPHGTIMDIFPDYNIECNAGFTSRTGECITGIKEIYNIGKVNDTEINPDNMAEIIANYSYLGTDGVKLYGYSQDPRFDKLDNLGIQTTIVYANILDTVSYFTYDQDPREVIATGEFYKPDSTKTSLGDGIVLTASALVPGIKWAQDFVDKVPGSKPILLAEMCSDFEQRVSVFDDLIKRKVTKNSYFGIRCDCKGTPEDPKDGKDCDHSGMVVQSGLIEFIVNSAIDNQVGTVGPKFTSMSETQLVDFVEQCKLLLQVN